MRGQLTLLVVEDDARIGVHDVTAPDQVHLQSAHYSSALMRRLTVEVTLATPPH